MSYKKHIAYSNIIAKEGLRKLNNLNLDKVLFLVDKKDKLIGSLTDGDLRRGLLSGLNLSDPVEKFAKNTPAHIDKSNYSVNDLVSLRKQFEIIPVLNDENEIVDVINFRLKSLTKKTPKPLLKVGDKSSIQHNIDRLTKFGISNYYFCLNHMKEKIENHLNKIYGNKEYKGLNLNYIYEKFAMGTIGSVSQINEFKNEYVLITNADVITKIDYEKFFLDFKNKNADLSMITIPYSINVPYGVTSIETSDNSIVSLDEKPKYTHYCNAGIYLLKKSIISEIPNNEHYNATDLVKKLIKDKFKVISHPTHDYWMDIGSIEDYEQANKDIKNLSL